MTVYRLSKKKWAEDKSGEGARLFGGRWNTIGTPCIYTCSNRALTVLEYSCHVPLDEIPRALCFTLYEIPEKAIYECKGFELPGDWQKMDYSDTCREFGTHLFKKINCLVIRVPSVVVPYEYNYLINPIHPDMNTKVNVLATEDYSYDIRIKD